MAKCFHITVVQFYWKQSNTEASEVCKFALCFLMTAPVLFQYLRVAWLTYPYHCCAFQFPATHHPEEFAKHEVSMHTCEEVKSNSPILTRVSKKKMNEFSTLKEISCVKLICVQTTIQIHNEICVYLSFY